MNTEKVIYNDVIRNISKINRTDPNLISGEPKELLYSKRMLDTLIKFLPDADDDLKVACYGQHIKRWAYPRSNYPEGRVGYLKWRKELYTIHADLVIKTIEEAGGNKAFIESVKDIMVNKVSGDSHSQPLEDVACLVFLSYYLEDFIKKHDKEKLIYIIKKTWNKMSNRAHKMALSFNYPDEQMTLIKSATT